MWNKEGSSKFREKLRRVELGGGVGEGVGGDKEEGERSVKEVKEMEIEIGKDRKKNWWEGV